MSQNHACHKDFGQEQSKCLIHSLEIVSVKFVIKLFGVSKKGLHSFFVQSVIAIEDSASFSCLCLRS